MSEMTPEQERLAEASGHPFDPGDHDPDLVDDNHLCHTCGHPRRLHLSEVEVAAPWTCDVCGLEISTREEAIEHAQSELHRVSLTAVADRPQPPVSPPAQQPAAFAPARAIVHRPPPTVDAYERGYAEGYGYAQWRGSLRRPRPPRQWWTGITRHGVVWEYDFWDWTVRIVFLLIGLLVGLGFGHAF